MSGPFDVAGSPSARRERECKACGNFPGNVKKIKELENEVQTLTEKAVTAADKLADYEEEVRSLKANTTRRTDSPVDTSLLSPDGTNDPTAFIHPGLSRQTTSSSIGRFSFLSTRKPLPAPPPQAQETTSLADLQAALAKETSAREQAEGKVAALSTEIEELSVTLFEQANEMVATERKARARLEERVKVLEVRDREKTGRLERIERAQERLERVKALLAP